MSQRAEAGVMPDRKPKAVLEEKQLLRGSGSLRVESAEIAGWLKWPPPMRLRARVLIDQLRLGRFIANGKTIWERIVMGFLVPADLRWKAAYKMNDNFPAGL